MKIRFNKWHHISELPKKDGSYAVIGFNRNGALQYMTQLDYTTEWGWNTCFKNHEFPIDFDRKYNDRYYWSSVTAKEVDV